MEMISHRSGREAPTNPNTNHPSMSQSPSTRRMCERCGDRRARVRATFQVTPSKKKSKGGKSKDASSQAGDTTTSTMILCSVCVMEEQAAARPNDSQVTTSLERIGDNHQSVETNRSSPLSAARTPSPRTNQKGASPISTEIAENGTKLRTSEPASIASNSSSSSTKMRASAPDSNSTSTTTVTEGSRLVRRNPTEYTRERESVYKECVDQPVLSMSSVQCLAFEGVPDAMRAIYWRVLLGLLPVHRAQWKEHLATMRDTYASFRKQFLTDPNQHKTYEAGEHPLSESNDATCKKEQEDADLQFEIDKDAKRTFPHLHFFNHNTDNGDTRHYEALRRILFIYAKLNQGIRYVQGMNEILAPIYYIFASDNNNNNNNNTEFEFCAHAEEDAFFCFTNVMAEVMNNFIKTLDDSEVGVHKAMKKLNNLLKSKDHALWANLEDKRVVPEFYSFRWITLMLTQEFELPTVMRLWDSLFADVDRFDFLYYFCCAMLIVIREELFLGTFAENVTLLQAYPIHDTYEIHKVALELRDPHYVAGPPPVVPALDEEGMFEQAQQNAKNPRIGGQSRPQRSSSETNTHTSTNTEQSSTISTFSNMFKRAQSALNNARK